MSQDRGKRLQKEVAAYLSRWWPGCESTPGGRPGTDVLGTPGVVWEVKTARNFSPAAFCKQAAGHARNGEFHPVVYLPPGIGGKSVGKAMAILEMDELMHLLVASGYAPAPALFEEVHYELRLHSLRTVAVDGRVLRSIRPVGARERSR